MAAYSKKSWHGILLLDKPQGLTSNQALQKVKRLFQADKVGHSGTLDPMATGMLPLLFGEASKFGGHLLEADKIYEFTCLLGVQTDSGDADGQVIEKAIVPHLEFDHYQTLMRKFTGALKQTPPMVSALWHQGQRLYDLARQGIEVERASRSITIHNLELCGIEPDRFHCRVFCSKGTYVRVLAEDMAKALGTVGHLIALRRTAVKPFFNNTLVTLEDVAEWAAANTLCQRLLAVDSALEALPILRLDESITARLKLGQRVPLTMALTESLYRLYDEKQGFFGLGEPRSHAGVRSTHVLAAKRLVIT